MKPGDYRFFGFRYRATFYIVSGATKKTRARQEPDYRDARQRHDEFIADLDATTNKGDP